MRRLIVALVLPAVSTLLYGRAKTKQVKDAGRPHT